MNFGYGLGLFSLIYLLVSFLPSLAASIRRLHDTGKSGWWCLLYFIPFGVLVLIYFLVQPSESGSNQYVPVPSKTIQNAIAWWRCSGSLDTAATAGAHAVVASAPTLQDILEIAGQSTPTYRDAQSDPQQLKDLQSPSRCSSGLTLSKYCHGSAPAASS